MRQETSIPPPHLALMHPDKYMASPCVGVAGAGGTRMLHTLNLQAGEGYSKSEMHESCLDIVHSIGPGLKLPLHFQINTLNLNHTRNAVTSAPPYIAPRIPAPGGGWQWRPLTATRQTKAT